MPRTQCTAKPRCRCMSALHVTLTASTTVSHLPSNRLGEYHVNLSAPFRPSHLRVISSQIPLHETSVLVPRDAEGPLADAAHPRTHRLHRVARRSPAPPTPTAPRRDHRNDAGAPRVPKPQARHARERPPPEHIRARTPRCDGRRGALRIRQGTYEKKKILDRGEHAVSDSLVLLFRSL